MRVGMLNIENRIYNVTNDGPESVQVSPPLVTILDPLPPAPPDPPDDNNAVVTPPKSKTVQGLGLVFVSAALVYLFIDKKNSFGKISKNILPIALVGGLGYLYFQSQKNKQ